MNTVNTVKKSLIAITLASTVAAGNAYAERSEKHQTLLQGGIFTTLAVVGAVAAGPIGMFVGAAGGAFLAEETKAANSVDRIQKQADDNIAALEDIIQQHEQAIAQLEKATVEKLVFQIMFPTGEDTLDEQDIERIQVLANYLKENPNLSINLDGHADPRGTDEYNNVLAQERAESIKKSLTFFGIDEGRIFTHGHGSSFSTAPKGDLDAYAQERRVDIEINNSDSQSPVVKN